MLVQLQMEYSTANMWAQRQGDFGEITDQKYEKDNNKKVFFDHFTA